MSTKQEDVVRRYYEAFNARDLAKYAELFTADCVIEAPGVSMKGIDAMRGFDQVWTAAFPSARVETLRMSTIGSMVAASNWLHGGRHDGPLKTPQGEVPPTGGRLDVPYTTTFELENGRIKLQRLSYDAAAVPAILAATR